MRPMGSRQRGIRGPHKNRVDEIKERRLFARDPFHGRSAGKKRRVQGKPETGSRAPPLGNRETTAPEILRSRQNKVGLRKIRDPDTRKPAFQGRPEERLVIQPDMKQSGHS